MSVDPLAAVVTGNAAAPSPKPVDAAPSTTSFAAALESAFAGAPAASGASAASSSPAARTKQAPAAGADPCCAAGAEAPPRVADAPPSGDLRSAPGTDANAELSSPLTLLPADSADDTNAGRGRGR